MKRPTNLRLVPGLPATRPQYLRSIARPTPALESRINRLDTIAGQIETVAKDLESITFIGEGRCQK